MEEIRKKRMAFAKAHEHWTVEDWGKVMFSDESHFKILRDSGNRKYRRPVGSNRYDARYTRKTVKHPDKQMVWGCFSIRGQGGLHFLPPKTMMNRDLYHQVLAQHLRPFMRS